MNAPLEISAPHALIQVTAGASATYQLTVHNLSEQALNVTGSIINNSFQSEQHYRLQLLPRTFTLEAHAQQTCSIRIHSGSNAGSATQQLSYHAQCSISGQSQSVSHDFAIQLEKNFVTDLLPAILRRDAGPEQILSHVLHVMHDYHGHIEQGRAILPAHFNPYTCPEHFIPLLIRMLDLDRIFSQTQAVSADPKQHRSSCPIGRLRNVIAVAMHCSHWRGTSRGLRLMLQSATGAQDFTIIENSATATGAARAFHILVEAPANVVMHENLIQRIISSEKPAYVTAELIFPQISQQARLVPTLGLSA